MPRVETFKIFWWLWVAAEVNDYDHWTSHRTGLTATHATWRLGRTWRVSRRERRRVREEQKIADIMLGGYPG